MALALLRYTGAVSAWSSVSKPGVRQCHQTVLCLVSRSYRPIWSMVLLPPMPTVVPSIAPSR